MLAFNTDCICNPVYFALFSFGDTASLHGSGWAGCFLIEQQHRVEQVAVRFPVVNTTSCVSLPLYCNILNSSS